MPAVTGTVDVCRHDPLGPLDALVHGHQVGSLADGATVTVQCWVTGSAVSGTYGTTSRWGRMSTGYVSHACVSGATGATTEDFSSLGFDCSAIYHVYLLTSPTAIVHVSDHDADITTNTHWAPTTGRTMPYVLRPLP